VGAVDPQHPLISGYLERHLALTDAFFHTLSFLIVKAPHDFLQ
jgi:hypothetical protein